MKRLRSFLVKAVPKTISKQTLFVVFLALTMISIPSVPLQALGNDAEKPALLTYSVDLDVCHAAITNEGTGHEITVVFLGYNNKFLGKDSKTGVSENCMGADATFKAELREKPRKIRISTSGDDGLFIDEIHCYVRGNLVKENQYLPGVDNPSRSLLGHHGGDNGKGWCLSTDYNDAYGEWKGRCENGCKSSQTFSFSTGVNRDPNSGKEDRYVVRIDNCHSDIGNEGTGNTITVEFLSGNTVIYKSVKNGVPENCYTADAIFLARSAKRITSVRVSTNGNDGYYIDELRLFKNDKLIKQYGGDNGGGWCISTDPQDAHGEWKGKCSGTGNSCSKSVNFPY